MKISQNQLPFIVNNALLVVLERKNGSFHYIHDGILVEIDKIQIEPVPYSDKEGFFVSSGKNGVYGSGISYKDNKENIKGKFIKELHDTLKVLVQKYSIECLYIFTPKDTVPSILEGIAGGVVKEAMIKNIFFGNMSKKHPLQLIEMIKEYEEEKAELAAPHRISREAEKIVKKARKAEKAMGKNL